MYFANPDYKDPVDLNSDYSSNQALYLDAQLAADQADQRKADTLAKINLAKDKLALHQNILNDMISALTIVASFDGTFVPLTAVGLFVRKGHLLGEIAP